MRLSRPFELTAVAAAAALALAGCGGGEDAPAASAPPPAPLAAAIGGKAFKGPMAAATVCLYTIDNSATDKKGAKVAAQAGSTPTLADGCVVTANDGSYSLVVPTATTGDLLVESTGGTYCSDESVFNGTACAGGGTPVAMGTAKLRTVVGAPASGAVAGAPLTLLTTAATNGPGTLSLANFDTAYGRLAGNFGLAGTNARTAPDQGALKTALQLLAGYLGGDSTLLGEVVSALAGGSLTAPGGEIAATTALVCQDLNIELSSYPAFLEGACTNVAGGQSMVGQYNFNWQPVLTGSTGNGFYKEIRYSTTCEADNREEISSGTTDISVTLGSTTELPLQASTSATTSQSGSASRLSILFHASGGTQDRTVNHLFCRTPGSQPGNYAFHGYLTAQPGPVKDGFLSRIDSATLFTAYFD